MSDDDRVFKALADGSRRQLLDTLRQKNGQTLSELCAGLTTTGLAITRQAVTKHLLILEEANLVVTAREGRQKRHYLNPVPINDIHARWTAKFEQGRLQALHNLKQALQEKEKQS